MNNKTWYNLIFFRLSSRLILLIFIIASLCFFNIFFTNKAFAETQSCDSCMTETWDRLIKAGYTPEYLVTHVHTFNCNQVLTGEPPCDLTMEREWLENNKRISIKCQATDDQTCKDVLYNCPDLAKVDECYRQKTSVGNVDKACCSQSLINQIKTANTSQTSTTVSPNTRGQIYKGWGIFKIDSCSGSNIDDPGKNDLVCVVNNAISILMTVTGAIVVVMIIISGIGYMTSAGNPTQTAWAKKSLVGSVIGLIIVVMSYSIVKLLTILLG